MDDDGPGTEDENIGCCCRGRGCMEDDDPCGGGTYWCHFDDTLLYMELLGT